MVVGCSVEMTTKDSSGKWPWAAGGSQSLGLLLLFKDKPPFILLSDINTLWMMDRKLIFLDILIIKTNQSHFFLHIQVIEFKTTPLPWDGRSWAHASTCTLSNFIYFPGSNFLSKNADFSKSTIFREGGSAGIFDSEKLSRTVRIS